MSEGVLRSEEAQGMQSNRYAVAGWLALAQAILFPVAIGVDIVQGLIGASIFGTTRPIFGPSDLLFLIYTGIWIYTLVKFRSFLHERYDFHGIDVLITFVIAWGILYAFGNLLFTGVFMLAWPVSRELYAIVAISFLAVSMITAGILDILIAVNLLRIKEHLGDFLRAFVYLTLATGILEATVFLSPLALLLVPVWSVMLAIVFLRAREEAEFV